MRQIFKVVGQLLLKAVMHEVLREIWEQVRDQWYD